MSKKKNLTPKGTVPNRSCANCGKPLPQSNNPVRGFCHPKNQLRVRNRIVLFEPKNHSDEKEKF